MAVAVVGTVLKTKAAVLDFLRGEIRRREGRDPATGAAPAVPTGLEPLDAVLPGGGMPVGALADWVAGTVGGGAWTLAMLASAGVCRDGRRLMVFDPDGDAYPPALLGLVPLEGLVLVRPRTVVAAVRALERCLACPAVGAVVAPAPPRLDDLTARRLRHAAEQGGAAGLLIRPAAMRTELPAATVRLCVRPMRSPRRLRRFHLRLERAPGLSHPVETQLEVDLETGRVSACAGLPDAAAEGRAGRASG